MIYLLLPGIEFVVRNDVAASLTIGSVLVAPIMLIEILLTATYRAHRATLCAVILNEDVVHKVVSIDDSRASAGVGVSKQYLIDVGTGGADRVGLHEQEFLGSKG